MYRIPAIPSFRPKSENISMNSEEYHPPMLPFLWRPEFLVVAVTTNDQSYISNPTKFISWQTGKITSPKHWWMFGYKILENPGLYTCQLIAPGRRVPPALAKLYSPTWQLRLALKHNPEMISRAVFEARKEWAEAFSIEDGLDYDMEEAVVSGDLKGVWD